MVGLQIQPELRVIAEEMAQAQRRIACDRPDGLRCVPFLISCLLVIVNNFNIGRAWRLARPFDANLPLIVDAITELPFAISLQRFKVVPRQGQVGNATYSFCSVPRR